MQVELTTLNELAAVYRQRLNSRRFQLTLLRAEYAKVAHMSTLANVNYVAGECVALLFALGELETIIIEHTCEDCINYGRPLCRAHKDRD